jgi:hypothetical protein
MVTSACKKGLEILAYERKLLFEYSIRLDCG